MRNLSSLTAITVGITVFISLIAGCKNKTSQTPQEETTMSETAGTPSHVQQKQILKERNDTTMKGPPIFKAKLASSNKAPDRDTNASGTVVISLQGDSIHLKGRFSGLSSAYTGSTIHKVLVDKKVQELSPTLKDNKTAGSWESSYKLTKDQISALKGDSLYIRVYSKAYESSEISGQIRAVDSLSATPDTTQRP